MTLFLVVGIGVGGIVVAKYIQGSKASAGNVSEEESVIFHKQDSNTEIYNGESSSSSIEGDGSDTAGTNGNADAGELALTDGDMDAGDLSLTDGSVDADDIAEDDIESSSNSADSSDSIEENTDDSASEIYTEDYSTIEETQIDSGDVTTVSFAGDILFDPGYAIMNKISSNGGTVRGIIGDSLLSIMQSSDIMMINNEFPYSTGGTPTENKTFTFRANPSSASLLNEMGVDIVTLANNHAYDYGAQALVDSVDALDSAGILHVGAGRNLSEASKPAEFVTSSGQKIVIIGTTQVEQLDNPDTKGATETEPGVFRCLDDTLLLSEIKAAKEEGAFVIVFIHWGKELQVETDWWQQKQAPEIVAAGADLIIGCHAHILQKIDYIEDTPIVYSLGNFLFNSKTLDSCIVQAEISEDDCKLKFVPAIQSGCKVNEATGSEAVRILEYMRSLSTNVYIDTNGYITKR